MKEVVLATLDLEKHKTYACLHPTQSDADDDHSNTHNTSETEMYQIFDDENLLCDIELETDDFNLDYIHEINLTEAFQKLEQSVLIKTEALDILDEVLDENPCSRIKNDILQTINISDESHREIAMKRKIKPLIKAKLFKKNGKKYYVCPECNFEKVSWSAVTGHINQEHLAYKYTCTQCSFQTYSYDSMKRHKKRLCFSRI